MYKAISEKSIHELLERQLRHYEFIYDHTKDRETKNDTIAGIDSLLTFARQLGYAIRHDDKGYHLEQTKSMVTYAVGPEDSLAFNDDMIDVFTDFIVKNLCPNLSVDEIKQTLIDTKTDEKLIDVLELYKLM